MKRHHILFSDIYTDLLIVPSSVLAWLKRALFACVDRKEAEIKENPAYI